MKVDDTEAFKAARELIRSGELVNTLISSAQY